MKNWLREHGIWGHRIRGNGFASWLYLGSHAFHVQLAKHTSSTGFSFKWGGQEELLAGSLTCFYGLFWSWSPPFSWLRRVPRSGKYHEIQRGISLSWHSGILWWTFCCPTMGSSLDRFRHEFHVSNWILGRPRFTRAILEEGIPVSITIGQWDGDGPYIGTAVREHCEWKRRFSTTRRDDVQVSMESPGLPIPGKGENSWDQGDDGIYGFGGATLESAIEHISKDVLATRHRHGGPNWRPVPPVAPGTALTGLYQPDEAASQLKGAMSYVD